MIFRFQKSISLVLHGLGNDRTVFVSVIFRNLREPDTRAAAMPVLLLLRLKFLVKSILVAD